MRRFFSIEPKKSDKTWSWLTQIIPDSLLCAIDRVNNCVYLDISGNNKTIFNLTNEYLI